MPRIVAHWPHSVRSLRPSTMSHSIRQPSSPPLSARSTVGRDGDAPDPPVMTGQGCVDRAAGGDVPDAHGLVLAGADGPLAIAADIEADDLPAVPLQAEPLGAALQVPDSQDPVVPPRHEGLAVGGQRHVVDPASTAVERADIRPVLEVPEVDQAVIAADRTEAAIRRDRRGIQVFRVREWRKDFGAAGHVPEPGRAVTPDGQGPLAVRRDGDGFDDPLMAAVGEDLAIAAAQVAAADGMEQRPEAGMRMQRAEVGVGADREGQVIFLGPQSGQQGPAERVDDQRGNPLGLVGIELARLVSLIRPGEAIRQVHRDLKEPLGLAGVDLAPRQGRRDGLGRPAGPPLERALLGIEGVERALDLAIGRVPSQVQAIGVDRAAEGGLVGPGFSEVGQ